MGVSNELDDDLEMSNTGRLLEDQPVDKDAGLPKKGLRKQLVDIFCIILNIASTVTLVFLNNW